jgi:hypothetical protein
MLCSTKETTKRLQYEYLIKKCSFITKKNFLFVSWSSWIFGRNFIYSIFRKFLSRTMTHVGFDFWQLR